VFREPRDTSGLKGKCGGCEFRNVCMSCGAHADAIGDYMARRTILRPPAEEKSLPGREDLGTRRATHANHLS
jgi:hypothetical protein